MVKKIINLQKGKINKNNMTSGILTVSYSSVGEKKIGAPKIIAIAFRSEKEPK